MVINHNMSAMFAQRSQGIQDLNQQKSMEKLSSGMRINRAGDDASGLAVSEKMRAQIRGLNQASENASNGISFIQTTEGYLQETEDIVQRIRDMEDDIGFVYVFPEELDRFRYDLNRDQMDFEILGETPAMLFLKTEDMVGKTKERNKNWKGQKLIQTEMDQFRRQSDWTIEETGEVVEGLQVAVTTNSDYIMNIMMKENGLANISPRSFTHYAKQDQPGITLSRDEGKIVYGVLSRRDTVISGILKDLIEDIRQAIHE